MVDGVAYLTFEGQRKKKTGRSRWTDIETSIPMVEIKKITLVDNTNTSTCFDCGNYDQDNNSIIYNERCNECYANYEEEASYLEIEDDTYIYHFCYYYIFAHPDDRKFLGEILDMIKDGTQNVDVPNLEMEKERKEEEKRKAKMRECRRAEYNRKLKLKKNCGKCCCLQSDHFCLLGFKVVDGKPQEPCIKPESKSHIEETRMLIFEFGEKTIQL